MSELKRTLGLPMLSFYGVGMILGAGIYSIIGRAAYHTGESLWIGFVFAGVAALLTAFSYAELSSMFPRAGAEFVYLGEAFPNKKWIGSTVGIAMAISGAATAAAVALAFAGYLNQFIEVSEPQSAVIILCVLCFVSIVGVRGSGWTNIVSTFIEAAGLMFIIYLGFKSKRITHTLTAIPHHGTLTGAGLIIFSFLGFESIVNLADESKRPQVDLPRAIFISVGISFLLYFLVSLSALALLEPEILSQSAAPLMTAAQTKSVNAGLVLGIVALFSTGNTALIAMISSSRILYSMSKSKVLPQVASAIMPGRQTPWVASILVVVVSLMLLPLGQLETVASVSSLATLIAFFMVNVSLIVLRYSQSAVDRPFKVPFKIGKFPLIPFLGTLITLMMAAQYSMKVYIVTFVLTGLAAIVFIWIGRYRT